MNENEHLECATCMAKPGAPTLCPACIHNKYLIEKLKADIRRRDNVLSIINQSCRLAQEG